MGPSAAGMAKRLTSIPMLYDIEARIRMMEQWPGYEQVLTIAGPSR
jgi:aminocarboxymuconate-semialdehyde decarboxylase